MDAHAGDANVVVYIPQQTRLVYSRNSEDPVMRFPCFSDCNMLTPF